MKFEKHAIELFDGNLSKYGGHSQWMSRLTGLDYLDLSLTEWNFEYCHFYYDGFHHSLSFLWFTINWGGPPYNKPTL